MSRHVYEVGVSRQELALGRRNRNQDGTNLANGTVTSHNTLKETGGVSKKKINAGEKQAECDYLQRLNSSLRHFVRRSSSVLLTGLLS
jgi:hypothetical protein